MAEKTALEVLKGDIEKLKAQLTPLLKEDTDKWIQIACNFIESKWDKIKDANRPSLFSELMKIAQMGLYLDGEECSIVVFKGIAKRMTGYRGLLKLVRNSGELAAINAGVSYEKDQFEYFVDEKGEHLMHKPAFIKDRGIPVHTYCIARIKGSEMPYVEVMSEEQVQACRKSNRFAGEDSPWAGPFADEMRKKTVLRRISKRLPMSTDLRMAFNEDDTPEEIEPAPQAEPKTQSSALESAVGAAAPEVKAPAPATTAAPATAAAPVNTAAEEKKKVDDLKQTFSQNIEGVLAHVSGKDYPNTDTTKPPRRRFSCKIGEVFYGTWDQAINAKIEDFYNKKVVVNLKFVTQLNSKKQPYNEILDVTEKVAEEELPI